MARDLLLTSRTLDVDEMLACGVVTGKSMPDQVLGDVEQIAANAPIATRFTKRGLTPRAPQRAWLRRCAGRVWRSRRR